MPDFRTPFPYVPKSLGERIAHARRVLGVQFGYDLGPTDVARYLETSPSTVSNWERDIKRPSPDAIEPLAEALGVRPGYLLFGEMPMEAPLTNRVGLRWRGVLRVDLDVLPIPSKEPDPEASWQRAARRFGGQAAEGSAERPAARQAPVKKAAGGGKRPPKE